MQPLIFIIHVIIACVLVILVLLQHGKGADMGATFGGGASQSIFGSYGATPFLVKFTTILALIFFVTSLTLNHLSNTRSNNKNSVTSIIKSLEQKGVDDKGVISK